MTSPVPSRPVRVVAEVVQVPPVRSALRTVFRRLPQPMRIQLNRLQVRLGLMDGLVKVPEPELEASYTRALALVPADPDAVYLEFGVYVGSSMARMFHAARRAGRAGMRLIGFDSFQGMPPEVPGETTGWTWHEGQLYSDVALTRSNLRRLGVALDHVELVPGWFDQTLTPETRERLGLRRVGVAMFDCVLSTSTRLGLDFIAPLIVDDTVVYFDDWAATGLDDAEHGEQKAFREWLAAHPELRSRPLPDLAYGKDAAAFLVGPVPGTAAG